MDYNEEYFYIKPTDLEVYPMLEYARGGGDSMEIFDDIALDTTKTRALCFSKPIPKDPQLGDHHFLTANAPVISERLKNTLEGLNLKETQFLPTVVQNKEGEEHIGYYIIHVINLIECMDKDKSEWTPSRRKPGKASDVNKLVLDNEALGKIALEERLVFALWENSLNVLYHQSVVEKILEIAPTGLTIYRLSKWDSKTPFVEEYVDNLQKRMEKS